MKTKNILYILLSVALLSSCGKERDLTYQGADVVEFSNPITGVNSKITGQSIGGISVLGDNPNIPIRGERDSVIIQLVGRQRSEPITISYSITPGTAVEGTDFEIIGTRGAVVIPANQSATAIRLRLLNSSVTPTNLATVSFRITGTSAGDVGVSENYKNFALSIFPMKAYLDRVLAGGQGNYLATQNGLIYGNATGNAATADIAVTLVSRSVNGVVSTVPVLISPRTLSGNAAASATTYSNRVFVPASTVPGYLLSSWATGQLGAVTAATVNAIPTSGATAAAVVNDSVDLVENGIYGFRTGAGKKGYIRVKKLPVAGSGAITIDVMAQP